MKPVPPMMRIRIGWMDLEDSFRPDWIEDPDCAASSQTAPAPEIGQVNPATWMYSHVEGVGKFQAVVVFIDKWTVVRDGRAGGLKCEGRNCVIPCEHVDE